MDSEHDILTNIRKVVGLTGIRSFADLGRVRQDRLESRLAAVSGKLSSGSMGSICTLWLLHQVPLLGKGSRRRALSRWVAFVRRQGLYRERALAMWDHYETCESCKSQRRCCRLPYQVMKRRDNAREELAFHLLWTKNDAPKRGFKRSSNTRERGGVPGGGESARPIPAWLDPKDLIGGSPYGSVGEYAEEDESPKSTWSWNNLP
ncbi:hypothetical protein ACJ41O_007938 [Fusarium nematophilum]